VAQRRHDLELPPARPIASAIAMPCAALAGPIASSNESVTSENASPFHANASATPIAPPSSETSPLSSSSAAPTRQRPKPSARSVPISRIRRLIVAYIVFAPATTAPSPSSAPTRLLRYTNAVDARCICA
jgi:hypothetical protein